LDNERKNNVLSDVLVITLKSEIWITPEAIRRFPNIIYLTTDKRPKYGVKRKFIKTCKTFIKNYKPKIILLIYVDHIVPDFIKLKRSGKMGDVKIVFCSRKTYPLDGKNLVRNVSLKDAKYLEIIVYTSMDIYYSYSNSDLRKKLHFIPHSPVGIGDIDKSVDTKDVMWKLAPCNFSFKHYSGTSNYIFSGGFAQRDYKSIVEAVRGLPVKLLIETSEKELKNTLTGELPENVFVNYKSRPGTVNGTIESLKDYLRKMAKSLFVVIPIRKISDGIPYGLTTLVQAQYLGKAIVTNNNSGFDWYFTNNIEGIEIPYEDVQKYRESFIRILEDDMLRKAFERNSREKGKLLSNSKVIDDYEKLCIDLLKQDIANDKV
jgi:glycosyltransferase involved in cell wall biosynthesis